MSFTNFDCMKNDIITKVYDVFSHYKLNKNMSICDCGCISNEEVEQLFSKKLKEIAPNEIDFYTRKAITTWGEVEDYKHFLPRIFEIYHIGDFSETLIDLEIIHNKLEYGKWKSWNIEEQKVINGFIKHHWKKLVNSKYSEISEFVLKDYTLYLPFNELLALWKFDRGGIPLRNFVEFVFREAE